ncbi:sensor histidine kinase [Anaerocolumna sp. MB42-C2]|uniref:sensor histidine kinase n=1 Tax=Anaerocolumna sp. MB42-C2 TaxID=3070997 RepID=UPI0027DF698A|nr:ATP-binding protein [Anaerocolumna sp. MB42-C2]WMJ86367.1 ATP-binding protein [Anaerocolumna sp. MB42-C2]
MAKEKLKQQNHYYEQQFELMKTALLNTKSLRHDMMNHISILYSLSDNKDKLKEYLSELMDARALNAEYACSGNLIVDSILNFKLQEAERKGIRMDLELNIPEHLDITSFDMTVILGNLLDNAISACDKLDKDERNIGVIIRYDKSRLLIEIKNPYADRIIYQRDQIQTTKEDKENHGIGLFNVRNTVEKYHGLLSFEHTENIFSVMALLFV